MCARQGALSHGLKSRAGPTRGTASCTTRVPTARWDLKEVGGKTLDRRTGSGYEATMRDEKAQIFKVRNLYGIHRRISDGHKCGRKCAIPGEISGVAIKLAPLKSGDDGAGCPNPECTDLQRGAWVASWSYPQVGFTSMNSVPIQNSSCDYVASGVTADVSNAVIAKIPNTTQDSYEWRGVAKEHSRKLCDGAATLPVVKRTSRIWYFSNYSIHPLRSEHGIKILGLIMRLRFTRQRRLSRLRSAACRKRIGFLPCQPV